MNPRSTTWPRVPLAVALAAALLVALTYGLSFAPVNGNHHTYVLEGLRKLDPELLRRDWLASETYPYHPAFAWIVVAAGRLGSVAWSLAIGNLLVVVSAMLIIYRLLLRIAPRVAPAAFVLLCLIVVLDETRSVAGSYIFDRELQPSGLASLALIFALAAFIRGRALAAGLGLAMGGVLHINFLLVGLTAFASAQCLVVFRQIRRGKRAAAKDSAGRQASLLLGPSLLVLFASLPLLHTMAGAETAAAARVIFQFVRSPHHYVPRLWLDDFVLLFAWQLLAVAALRWARMRQYQRARLLALQVAMVGIIAAATLLTTVVFVPGVSQLFFWRLAPFSVLLAQTVVCVGVATRVQAALRRRSPTSAHRAHHPLLKPLLVALAILASEAADELASSNLIRSDVSPSRAALFEWARRTHRDARFLTPPQLGEFRLGAERAIVADWKSTPILADELLEWYRRIGQVSGIATVTSREQAADGYARMDSTRLARLVGQYAVDYVVLPRDAPLIAAERGVVFRNHEFVVIDVRRFLAEPERQAIRWGR